jgi:chromosome partitioning protein
MNQPKRKLQTIGIFNEKGGVGKSTIATHLAAGLALRGNRVVLLDTDPQAHATIAFGYEKTPQFYDLTVRNAPWKNVLTLVAPEKYEPPNMVTQGQLYLCGSNVESRNIANSLDRLSLIRHRIQELDGSVDYFIIDTSPTPSLLHAALTAACDHILIPTDCQAFGAKEGVSSTMTHVTGVRNEALARGMDIARPLGIIPNKYQGSTVLQNDILQYLGEHYGDLVLPQIPLLTTFGEAQAMEMLLYAFAPKSKATKYMWQLVDRVMEGVYAS